MNNEQTKPMALNLDALAQLKIALRNVDAMLEGLQEALASVQTVVEALQLEPNVAPEPTPVKRGRGRPKKVQTVPTPPPTARPPKPVDPLFQEAIEMGGTTDPALAERLKKRYSPYVRGTSSLGPGVQAGNKKFVIDDRKAKSPSGHVSVEDE